MIRPILFTSCVLVSMALVGCTADNIRPGFAVVKRDACSMVNECTSTLQTPTIQSGINAGVKDMSNPMLAVQKMVGYLCGMVVGDTLKCLEPYLDDCPDGMKAVYASVISVGFGASSDPDQIGGPGYDTLKKFVDENCQDVPQSYGTDTCVKEKLEDPALESCLEKATSKNQGECGHFNATKVCVDKVVGAECGKKKADLIVRGSGELFFDVSETCVANAFADDETNGSTCLVVSIVTLLISTLIYFV